MTVALTKQFADLPQPKIGDFRPGTPSFAPAENQRFSPGDPDAPSADNRDIWMQNAKAPLTNEGFALVFRGVKMSERTDSFACKTRSERAPPHFHAAIRNSGCEKQGTAAFAAVPVIYYPL